MDTAAAVAARAPTAAIAPRVAAVAVSTTFVTAGPPYSHAVLTRNEQVDRCAAATLAAAALIGIVVVPSVLVLVLLVMLKWRY